MADQVRKILYDTNILIDALNGIQEATDELEHWDDPAISGITWIEVYAGAKSQDEKNQIDAFMASMQFRIIEVSPDIRQTAADLIHARRIQGQNLRVPDAIIAATATLDSAVLITRNPKDFKLMQVRVPYNLVTTTAVSATGVLPRGADPLPDKFVEGDGPTLTVRK